MLRHRFPEPDGMKAVLVLKPRFDTPDFAFKNEPGHVNLFIERFAKGRHFLLETKHSGRPVEPHTAMLRIKDFRR